MLGIGKQIGNVCDHSVVVIAVIVGGVQTIANLAHYIVCRKGAGVTWFKRGIVTYSIEYLLADTPTSPFTHIFLAGNINHLSAAQMLEVVVQSKDL